MNPEVMVRITGVQDYAGIDMEFEPVEVMTVGSYTFENGKHCITYDESFDDSDFVKNTISIADGEIIINKSGSYDVEMIFEKDKTSMSYYSLPFGDLEMYIATRKLDLCVEDSRIMADIDYSLSMNGEHMADCHVNMDISDRTAGKAF